MAILVVAQIPVGVYAADLPLGIQRLVWISHHKSIGITILALMLMRLVWRWMCPPPGLPATMPRWQRRTAWLTHWALYVLLIGAAMVGWLSVSAYGLSINWFGYGVVPDLIGKNKALADALLILHRLLVWTLVVLIVVHVTAALRHAVRRDGVMWRILL